MIRRRQPEVAIVRIKVEIAAAHRHGTASLRIGTGATMVGCDGVPSERVAVEVAVELVQSLERVERDP